MKKNTPQNFKEYLAAFPPETRSLLKEIREIVMSVVPDAVEVISYGMPGFKKKGMLLWIGAYNNHVGFYPKASGIKAFEDQLGAYTFSKGTIQFPIGKKLPVALIKKIVKFRLNENLTK